MKKNRLILLVGGVVALLVLGVVMAYQVNLETPNTTQIVNDLQIAEITLGALTDPSQATKEQPTLNQKREYTPFDQIALRITTTQNVKDTIEITARLLDQEGRVTALTPSTLSFEPGTSTFCCWTLPIGTFNLQIFRPEQRITSIPIVIRHDSGPNTKFKVGP